MFPPSLTQCVGLWSVDDVQTWLEFINLKQEYGPALKAAKVDGAKLVRLTADVDGNVFGLSTVNSGMRGLLEQALRPLLEAHHESRAFPRSLASKGICDWGIEEVQEWLQHLGLGDKYGPPLRAAEVKGLELLYIMSGIPESPFRERGVGLETLAKVEQALRKKVESIERSQAGDHQHHGGDVSVSRLILGQLENGAVSGEVTFDQLRLSDTFDFRNGRLRCGRSRTGNDVVVFDTTMSRHHFEVHVEGPDSESATIRDINSSTGTFVMVPYARVEAEDIDDFQCELPARLRLGWRTDVHISTRESEEGDVEIYVEVEVGFGEDTGRVFGPYHCDQDEDSVSLIVGRDPERCSVVLMDPQVSSVHCEIVWYPSDEGLIRIRDFSSTNRTWHRVRPWPSDGQFIPYTVYVGDVIKAGEVAFVLFDRLAWSDVPAGIDDRSDGDASGASSVVLVPTHQDLPRSLPRRTRHSPRRGSRRAPIPTRSGRDGGPRTGEYQPTGRSAETEAEEEGRIYEEDDGYGGAPRALTPGEIFHARLRMLSSQREAHQQQSIPVPSAPSRGSHFGVTVCARVRPLFGCGAEGTSQCVITSADKKRIVLEDPRHRELPKEFQFDHVFDSSVTTSTIFKTHVARGIDAAVLSHVPCTVFAHGASGSGKTFTMQGIEGQPSEPVVDGNESGLIPMCVERIFKRLTSDMMVTMSVFEIYQEKVRDLLAQSTDQHHGPVGRRGVGSTSQPALLDRDGGFRDLKMLEDSLGQVQKRQRNQPTGPPAAPSGRGRRSGLSFHEQKRVVPMGRIMLVDLAGLEDNRVTGNIGGALRESTAINASHFALARMLWALKKNRNVPYRNSKLTRLFQNSMEPSIPLPAPPMVLMLVTVSPATKRFQATYNTFSAIQ
ncbi:Kinesin-like protein kif22, partial [Perkinsus chesapeaki]